MDTTREKKAKAAKHNMTENRGARAERKRVLCGAKLGREQNTEKDGKAY